MASHPALERKHATGQPAPPKESGAPAVQRPIRSEVGQLLALHQVRLLRTLEERTSTRPSRILLTMASRKPAIQLKRAYEPASSSDGARVLVDRLWPRGLAKERLPLDGWTKELAPSTELRTWFAHTPSRWAEFKARYFRELDAQPEATTLLLELSRQGKLTLVFSAKDLEHNNAAALKEYLELQLKAPAPRSSKHDRRT
jgi:uncharacterized protein YeaO (DUF488 family)